MKRRGFTKVSEEIIKKDRFTFIKKARSTELELDDSLLNKHSNYMPNLPLNVKL